MINRDGLFQGMDDAYCISTISSRKVNPFDAQPDDIDIYDIAHSLARSCRYNGHVGGFLSVARHSIWVMAELPDDLALTGLLHDASEAYLGDLVKPLKYRDDLQVFRDAEARLEAVIAERFGIVCPLPPEVIEADRRVTVELEMGAEGRRWHWNTPPARDQRAFLSHYDRLTRSPE